MSPLVAVTGATGHIGAELVRQLRKRGAAVRAIGRSAARLAPLAALGAEAREGSIADAGFLARVFAGADAVFALVPPDYATADHRAYQRQTADHLARAVEAARVPSVVTLSSLGAELDAGTGPIAGLHDLEKRIEQIAGVRVVHLRPTYFMENELNNIGLIKTAGITGSPLKADLLRTLVATRDVAVVAAELLCGPAAAGISVRELLGPREYTSREVASCLGTAVGRPDLAYVEFPYGDARKALLQHGMSANVADLFVEMYQALNDGRVRSLQGRSAQTTTPTTLEQFAKDTFAPAFAA
jgi:uncharacterized protein YbjT (DUF2867 family)